MCYVVEFLNVPVGVLKCDFEVLVLRCDCEYLESSEVR